MSSVATAPNQSNLRFLSLLEKQQASFWNDICGFHTADHAQEQKIFYTQRGQSATSFSITKGGLSQTTIFAPETINGA